MHGVPGDCAQGGVPGAVPIIEGCQRHIGAGSVSCLGGKSMQGNDGVAASVWADSGLLCLAVILGCADKTTATGIWGAAVRVRTGEQLGPPAMVD